MISGETRLVGLLGDPVSGSLSPLMQNAAFVARGLDWTYVPLAVPAETTYERTPPEAALHFRETACPSTLAVKPVGAAAGTRARANNGDGNGEAGTAQPGGGA